MEQSIWQKLQVAIVNCVNGEEFQSEEILEDQIKAVAGESGIPLPVRNKKIFSRCNYEWDFVWYDVKLVVECQGGLFMQKGAHNTGKAITRDILKNNVAVMHDWDVLFYSTAMVKSGEAVNEIEKYLLAKKEKWGG